MMEKKKQTPEDKHTLIAINVLDLMEEFKDK